MPKWIDDFDNSKRCVVDDAESSDFINAISSDEFELWLNSEGMYDEFSVRLAEYGKTYEDDSYEDYYLFARQDSPEWYVSKEMHDNNCELVSRKDIPLSFDVCQTGKELVALVNRIISEKYRTDGMYASFKDDVSFAFDFDGLTREVVALEHAGGK